VTATELPPPPAATVVVAEEEEPEEELPQALRASASSPTAEPTHNERERRRMDCMVSHTTAEWPRIRSCERGHTPRGHYDGGMNVAQTRSDAARRWASGWRPEVWLFDFDGTLADSLDLIMASFRHATGRVLGA